MLEHCEPLCAPSRSLLEEDIVHIRRAFQQSSQARTVKTRSHILAIGSFRAHVTTFFTTSLLSPFFWSKE